MKVWPDGYIVRRVAQERDKQSVDQMKLERSPRRTSSTKNSRAGNDDQTSTTSSTPPLHRLRVQRSSPYVNEPTFLHKPDGPDLKAGRKATISVAELVATTPSPTRLRRILQAGYASGSCGSRRYAWRRDDGRVGSSWKGVGFLYDIDSKALSSVLTWRISPSAHRSDHAGCNSAQRK